MTQIQFQISNKKVKRVAKQGILYRPFFALPPPSER